MKIDSMKSDFSVDSEYGFSFCLRHSVRVKLRSNSGFAGSVKVGICARAPQPN